MSDCTGKGSLVSGVRRSLSELLEVWFSQQVISWCEFMASLWFAPFSMKELVRRMWKAYCQRSCRNSALSFGGTGGSTEKYRGTKAESILGFCRGFLKQDRTTSIQLGDRSSGLARKDFCNFELHMFQQKCRRVEGLLSMPCLGVSNINKYQQVCPFWNFRRWIILSML